MFCASSASATCRFDPSVERNPANTLCPERERVSAVKRPKPLDAPVIRIVFPIVLLESLRFRVTAHCRYCLGEDRDDLTLNLLLSIPTSTTNWMRADIGIRWCTAYSTTV